jgi:hypothetical protein
MPPL